MTPTTRTGPIEPAATRAAPARPLEIAVLTTEFAPLARVGGLADVAAALSLEMARLGARITVWMPAWRAAWESGVRLTTLPLPRPLRVPLGREMIDVGILEVVEPPEGVRILLIDYPPLYWRNGIYVDPVTGEAWPDQDRRLVLFQRAVLEALPILDLRPDLFHCHDHQTGLVPVYLKTLYADDPFYRKTGTLLTIHNLGYQGLFPSTILELARLPMDLFYPAGPLEFWGRVNFMKGGILYADRLTTVSPRYATEIQSSEEFGFGLEGVLGTRAADLIGILNGIDTSTWNPATDPYLVRTYDAEHLERKQECRTDLAARTGLRDLDEGTPILGISSRLVDQRGFDLFAPQVPALIDAGFRIVVAGSGLRKYEEQMLRFRERYPGKFHWSRVIDDAMAHRLAAGADFYLMPSKYEPCGLNQMISMRYGTLPIVRETGGLIDTVLPYNEATGAGTGFGFRDYTAEALLAVVRMALTLFRDPGKLARLRRQAMAQDFSFGRPARAYLALAEEIAAAHREPRPVAS